MKKSTRLGIFFILVFCMFYLFNKITECWVEKLDLNKDVVILLSGMIFTLLIICVYMISKFNDDSENFWDVSPASQCKGGPYFWQGDSPTSKMCRELASTPEGRMMISGYNCPVGYVGQPGLPFVYTPLSDDNWQNSRCERQTCKGQDVGMCSFEKQIP